MNQKSNPNILLIVLDSVRARNTSLHGHLHETTPFLDSFSNKATIYKQARAPGFYSLPSHASMFTGMDVEEHGLYARSRQLPEGYTIWEKLRDDHAYSTAVFSDNAYITQSDFGLSRGFEVIEHDVPHKGYLNPKAGTVEQYIEKNEETSKFGYIKYCLQNDYPLGSLLNGIAYQYDSTVSENYKGSRLTSKVDKSRKYAKELLSWIDCQDRPWAACVNFMTTHSEYRPQPKYNLWADERLQSLQESTELWDFFQGNEPWWIKRSYEALYDGCIRQVDASLKYIVNSLSNRSELKDTLVVITGDHGDGFGEPSRVRPGYRVLNHVGSLHEVMLHVPLIVKYPGQTSGIEVDQVTSLSEFSTVVSDSLTGESDASSFVTDREVVSYGNMTERWADTIPDSLIERYPKLQEIKSQYGGEAKAVFESDGEFVQKYLVWGDNSATIRVRDAQESMKVSTSVPRQRISFDSSSSSVCDFNSEIDADTRTRLKELGYMNDR